MLRAILLALTRQHDEYAQNVVEQIRKRSEQFERRGNVLIGAEAVDDIRGVIKNEAARQRHAKERVCQAECEAENNAGDAHAKHQESSNAKNRPEERKILPGHQSARR